MLPSSPGSPSSGAPRRRLLTAEILAIGSELTTGETRDTNSHEVARSLGAAGVSVRRIAALPDDLDAVTAAFAHALASVDLVVATGGLGPTPDDLTREALAAAVGEVPAVDPLAEAWQRDRFARRGMAMPEVNLKQAWMIPSATSIPNPNGSAPGWWVEQPAGQVAIVLPGPPREMRPMWSGWALERLRKRGLGDGRVVLTLRTTGIGESSLVERLGDAVLRRANPLVATYARADAVDIRISAVDESLDDGGRPAAAIVEASAAAIRSTLAGHIWAEGEASWGDVVAQALAGRRWRLAIVEAGTRGALGALLADVPALRRATSHADEAAGALADGGALADVAAAAAAEAGANVGLGLAAMPEGGDTHAYVALVTPADRHLCDRVVFLGGPQGRLRAAVYAASTLLTAGRGRPSG